GRSAAIPVPAVALSAAVITRANNNWSECDGPTRLLITMIPPLGLAVIGLLDERPSGRETASPSHWCDATLSPAPWQLLTKCQYILLPSVIGGNGTCLLRLLKTVT